MATRREVIQGLIVTVGGASLLTACGGVGNVIATDPASGKWRFFSDSEMALVSRISDLLLPRTDTPGALDVNVPGFLDALMSEWASAATQQQQHGNLTRLNKMLNTAVGEEFSTAPMLKAEQTLKQFDATAFQSRGTYAGYIRLKSVITQSYFASEGGATEELKWVATPGRWDPNVAI